MSGSEPQRRDPRGLIREAFRMDGISEAECRSVFLDWALGLPDGLDPAEAILGLLEDHAAAPPEHPMRRVLEEGLAAPRRRLRRRREN